MDYAASRVAPVALFAVEAGATPAGYEALGNRVARAALGLGPSAGQKMPPNWCLQATPKWVPWGCEVSLRSARLKWSLEKGRIDHLARQAAQALLWQGYGKVIKKLPLEFRVFSPRRDSPRERTALSRRWIVQSKAQ